MGRKLILPEGFKGHNFLKTMGKMKHGRNRIRLLECTIYSKGNH